MNDTQCDGRNRRGIGGDGHGDIGGESEGGLDRSVPFDDEIGLDTVLGERGMAPASTATAAAAAEAPAARDSLSPHPGTRVFRASALRLVPSAFGALFFDRREVVTRVEVSDVWVYATMGWHQTFLWHRGQVRFEVSPEKRTLTVDSFGERVELRCPHFSRALMAELHEVLADPS